MPDSPTAAVTTYKLTRCVIAHQKPTRRPTRQPTAAALSEKSGFNIQLVFAPGTSGAIKSMFRQAAARWQSVITAGVPDVPSDGTDWFRGEAFAPYTGAVDDIVIAAQVAHIGNDLPISGVMHFDIDDVSGLIDVGNFVEVIMHEMGHVLGDVSGLIDDGNFVEVIMHEMGHVLGDVSGLIDDGNFVEVIMHEMGHVLGLGLWQYGLGKARCGTICDENAVRAFYADGSTGKCYAQKMAALLGVDTLEIVLHYWTETDGGPGTACFHWDETQLCSELMTGYLNSGDVNSLSIITIGGLQDIGYQVDYSEADNFNPENCKIAQSGTIMWSSDAVKRPVLAPPSHRRL
ncbi:hypothetical protein JKP88DRAFT_274716 [Tribonema minus]|uniref:Uncharacterized protein n=1 Tax=Tribonema minus TaxID=303371 RepID=A0A835ZKT3_9STRA|nr:hypothetical protein JKP88DRAFT_274716 [Tribonema minus]